jgi:hypothetical protein
MKAIFLKTNSHSSEDFVYNPVKHLFESLENVFILKDHECNSGDMVAAKRLFKKEKNIGFLEFTNL